MKLKNCSLQLGVTIQDVLNVANAQDPWIGHLAMLDRMKKTSIAPNAIKKILLISPNAADLGKIVCIRRLMGSTDQAAPSCFYFRIS